jgi:hypothetical protein
MPTATVSVDPSTRRLSEVARHVVVPEGIVDTLWFEVEAQCAEWGDEFDTWQDSLGQLALGLRADGLFAATIGGVTLSIPRQVAKTFIVGRITFALCALYPNLTVLWTAHRIRTASQTFEKLKGLARRPAVKALMADGRSSGIRSTNGEQEFHFRNGSRVLFGAREQGFGRGFDEVDIEVFDEAQILTEKALEDMVAATNQSRFPHAALLFFMGTPPRPSDPGVEFTNRRKEALEAKPAGVVYAEHGDAMYVECSADPMVGRPGGPPIDDLEQVAIANPSYPHRTPLVSIKRLKKQLTSEGSWRREGLGVWDEFEATKLIVPPGTWEATGVSEPPDAEGVKSFGIKFAPDGSRVSIAGAFNPDGEAPIHVELVGAHSGSMSAGTAALVQWVADRWQQTAVVVVDGTSHAGAFVNALREAGVPERVIKTPTWPEVATANAMYLDAIVTRSTTHLAIEGQQMLDDSVAGTTKKMHGDKGAWSWAPISEQVDEIPVSAASLAYWGAKTTKRRPGAGRNGGRRRAVVS